MFSTDVFVVYDLFLTDGGWSFDYKFLMFCHTGEFSDPSDQ